MQPQILSRKVARRHFNQETVGYRFPLPFTGGVYGPDDPDLPVTSDGVKDLSALGKPRFAARVRRLDLMTLVTLNTLSPTMQSIVMDIFGEAKKDDESERTFDDTRLGFQRERELVNGICVAGFLEPRLVETQEEADASDDLSVVWIEEIDDRDRKAFRDYVLRGEGRTGVRLEPFPANGLEDPAGDETVPPATTSVTGARASAKRTRLTRVS